MKIPPGTIGMIIVPGASDMHIDPGNSSKHTVCRNPAYLRQRISRRVRLGAPIQLKSEEEKKKTKQNNNNKLSHATFHMSCVTCHMSPVMCHLSHVSCHMSPFTCHLSTATATDPPPGNSPMLSTVVCKYKQKLFEKC